MRVLSALCACLAVSGAAMGATLATISMDAPVNNGHVGWVEQSPDGEAIYLDQSLSSLDVLTFLGPGQGCQHLLRKGTGGGGGTWWYGPYIDFPLADLCALGEGLGAGMAEPCARIEFDIRQYNAPTNTNPYHDTAVAFRLYQYAADGGSLVGYRTFNGTHAVTGEFLPGYVWGNQWGHAQYPEWTRVVIFVNKPGAYADSGSFDITKANRVRWFGTNWTGNGDDFVEIRNFVITNDPLVPTAGPVANDVARVNSSYSKQLTVDTCGFWTLTGPAGMTVAPATGLVSWAPTADDYGVTYNVSATVATDLGSDMVEWTVQVVGEDELVNIPFDEQVDMGAGPALLPDDQWTFEPPDGTEDNFGRFHLYPGKGANGWYFANVDLVKAGFGIVDFSSCHTRMIIDVRYFQQAAAYTDAPVVLRLYDSANRIRSWWFHRDTPSLHYPEWQHHEVYLNNNLMDPPASEWFSPDFDPTQVVRMEFMGTNWGGLGDDYVDFNNLIVTKEPVVPTVDPVTPSEHAVFVDVPYARQLTVRPCPDVTWELAPNGTGATISSTGLVSGWTPSADQLNQVFTFNVTATGPGGVGNVSWQVVVREPQTADTGLDGPWPMANANIFGTQSSDDPQLILDGRWGNGAEIDWVLNVNDFVKGHSLASRPIDRSTIVFDSAGNLYWKTMDSSDSHLCSVSPDGAVRWVGNSFGTPVSLGGADTTSPVVGNAERVYVVTSTGAAAFNKADGELVWSTTLTGSNLSSSANRFSPVLYGGKLYVLGLGTPTRKLYQLDALGGAVEWSADINDVNISHGGQMTLVPDAFGPGQHGLYFNGDSGNGADGKYEMYGVRIDTAAGAASLAWGSEGGKVARSHVIYVAAAGRVCTHTWDDYGGSFYSWNLDGSKLAIATNPGRAWHGWEDFGAVDFDGNDVIAGGFNGRIARYIDIAEPGPDALPDTLMYDAGGFENFALGSAIGQDGWVEDTDGGYPPVQVVEDPTGSGHGKVLMLDPPGTSGGWQGIFRAVDLTPGAVVSIEWDQWRTDTNDNFWVADNTAYDGWWAIGWDSSGTLSVANTFGRSSVAMTPQKWQHVKYTFDPSRGMVTLELDGAIARAASFDTALDGIDFQVEPTAAGGDGGPMYIDNVVVMEGAVSLPWAFAGAGWYQMNPDYAENRGTGGLYKNQAGKSIYVSGTSVSATNLHIVGFNVTDSEMYTAGPDQDEQPRWFDFDTGVEAYPNGGPLVGPRVEGQRQHIYFFRSDNELVALTYIRPVPGDCVLSDGTPGWDKAVDGRDFTFFKNCGNLNGPAIPVSAGCECADLDEDQDVDQDDYGLFLRCYLLPAPVSPDCAG